MIFTAIIVSELMYLIYLHKEKYNLYVTNKIMENSNKIVLRLMSYYCKLNPIELMWAQIKIGVAFKTFTLADVKDFKILQCSLELKGIMDYRQH